MGQQKHQRTLSDVFLESDAAIAERENERRAYLIGALARVGASSDLRLFVLAVQRHASDPDRWWQVTHAELVGKSPAPSHRVDPLADVLGCSERQAKRVTRQARQLGLVRTLGRDQSLGESLSYQLDWAGIRCLIGLDSRECQPVPRECQPVPRECQPVPRECQPVPSAVPACPSKNATHRNIPVPVPDRSFPDLQTPDRSGTGAQPRLLDGVTVSTLRDTEELLRLLHQVSAVSPIKGLGDSEADQLWIVTAAEFAMRTGKNPVGFFRFLIQRNKRDAPKVADEDAARKRLKELSICPA